MSELSCDVAVAGGGLVGLALAYELACSGAGVTVVDAHHAGRATDAGAGILSPETMAEDDPGWLELSEGAGRHYPLLIERLRADGADTGAAGFAACGLLSLGLRESEDAWFAPFVERVQRRSRDVVTEITPGDAAKLFPPLGEVHSALYNPVACRVDGRGMAAALQHAASARGVRFMPGVVRGVEATGNSGSGARRVVRVLVDGHEPVTCGAFAVAGGAWSAAMGEWFSCPLPIGPTKGQIVHLAVEGESGAWPIVQPLLSHYIVPWPGGRVACGGTFETKAGYSTTVTAAGLHELLRECLIMAPGLAGAAYLETRVGLRPTSADDRPVVGALTGWANAWVATGHGANGLLLGPYTSMLLASRITGAAAHPGAAGLVSCDPQRFG